MSKTNQTTENKKHIYDAIIEDIKKGTLPWNIPWVIQSDKSYITKKAYRGYNKLALGFARKIHSFKNSEWMTFSQAKAIAGKSDIKIMEKGTKSTSCFYYSTYENKAGETKPTFKTFFLFNTSQFTEEFQDLLVKQVEYKNEQLDVVDSDINIFSLDTNLSIVNGNIACYTPSKHEVTIPPLNTFDSSSTYYATLFHELIHSTSKHFQRPTDALHKQKENYSFEELIAEFGAAILCNEYNINNSNVQSSSYIEHWMKKGLFEMEKLFEAFKQAEQAVVYFNSVVRGDKNNENRN
jgi:antirestriction protein ArdC